MRVEGALAILPTLWGGLGSLAWTALQLYGLLALRRFPDLGRCVAHDVATWPRLSVVVAARDEADRIEAGLASLLEQDYPELEVIVVDDRSTDTTGEVVRRLSRQDARVVPIRIDRLPVGWLGKVHALHVATARATGEWILYTDADVHFAPGVLRRALAVAIARGVDHLAVGPEVRARGLLHRATLAAFQALFSVGVRAHRVGEPGSDAYAGVGAFNLVRRDALLRTPGFGWLRMEVVDDLGLGLMLHRAGARSALMTGSGLLEIEWYPSLAAMGRGLEKNLFAVIGQYSLVRAMVRLASLVALLASPAIALLGPVPYAVRIAGGLAIASSVVAAASARTRSRLGFVAILLAPVGQVVLLAFTVRSAWACVRRGGVVWRDTFYPLARLRAGQRVRL